MNKIVGRLKFNLKGILCEMDMSGGQMNEMSVQISFRMMNDTMKSCFTDCITDFKSGDLSSQEKSCLKNCASRSFTTMQLLPSMQEQMTQKQGGGFWDRWRGTKFEWERKNGWNSLLCGSDQYSSKTFSQLKIKTELTINKESFYKPSNASFSCVSSKIHACD